VKRPINTGRVDVLAFVVFAAVVVGMVIALCALSAIVEARGARVDAERVVFLAGLCLMVAGSGGCVLLATRGARR
jgi:hypothetical protein